MRIFLTLLLLFFASPSSAQHAGDCRGKQGFKLADGTTGCVAKIETGNYTVTKQSSRGGSATNSTTRFRSGSARIDTHLFGAFSSDNKIVRERALAICRTFKDQIKKEMGGTKYSKIVVGMNWPKDPNVRQQGTRSDTGEKVNFYYWYSVFANPRCTSARVMHKAVLY